MLDRHGKRMHEHEQSKPREPTGFLTRKDKFQKRNTWSEAREHLNRRQLQLRDSRERVSSIYKSPADQIAEHQLAGEQPELARKLTEIRQVY